MKRVIVRDLCIGEGLPKICVPVTGATEEAILAQAARAVREAPDLLEWRADFYEKLGDPEAVAELAGKIRSILRQVPMIFTVRTCREGGNCSFSTKDYVNTLMEAAKCPQIDLIDVELYRDPALMKAVIGELQRRGKYVIASNHHFDGTPQEEELQRILAQMEKSGADIRKLAVMPAQPEDVLRLLSVTLWAVRTGEHPVITMSMGSLGAVSRICGQVFGSAVTFAAVGEASAPGQFPLGKMKTMLENLRCQE